MVRRIVFVSVLQRMDTAAASVLRFAATRAFGVDCRVELVGVSLEEGGVTGSKTGEENSVAPRGDSPTVGRPRKSFNVDHLCSAMARRWIR